MSEDKIPRDREDDYTPEMAAKRRAFVRDKTGASLEHVGGVSAAPGATAGNIEHFMGMAQVPIGVAGPLLVDGEHAKGLFYVPMATTEGTLVASYNRGMRVLREVGGAKVTVLEQYMQRAPVFHFDDARAARDFGAWLDENLDGVRAAAEATTSVGKLEFIEQYGIARMRYLRFNYTTGDAAGQNMTGKATAAACAWIAQHHPGGARYTLSGGHDTDKKHSHLNTLRTRGKRVVAEVVLPRAVVRETLRSDVESLFRARLVSHAGAMLAGSVNNGFHAANGIAAMFIACGQDAANVAESHTATTFVEILPNGDYYWSITLPSLICGTYGGGTGLPTQRECLEMLGCYGAGHATKFAEIVGATVLAGEISLGAAVVTGDWVTSHEQYGRNR